MTGTFLATWTKLRRPALLGGTYAAVAAITALVTALTYLTLDGSGEAPAGPPGSGLGSATVESLSTSAGLLTGLSSAVTIFGVVALCVAASTFAGEFTTGTLRNLLIRQPRRGRLLAGMWAAVVTFVAGAVLVAAVVAGGTALLLAGGQGVDTSAWSTADGLGDSARTVGLAVLAVGGYATFGAALGVLLRAPVLAVAVGVAWLLPLETILTGVLDGADRWLPGQLLSAVAADGTSAVTLAAALVTAGAYLAVAAGAGAATFVRRDVTA